MGKMKMGEIAAMLLSSPEKKEKADVVAVETLPSDEDEVMDLALDGADELIEAVHARDAKGVVNAFRNLVRLAPSLPEAEDDEEEGLDEGLLGDD